MDDYEPWLTPCDLDFDPEKCESAYALWAVKEEGEPVKFLEASITDNLDYPSGYWFFWRTISFSEETGRLIEGEWGGAGDICRADYVADMVLPVIEVQLHKAGKSHITTLGLLQMEFALPLLRFTFGLEAALAFLLSFPGEISVAKLAVPCACFFVLIAGH